MVQCPVCGEDNLEGADACEGCQQPLDFQTHRHARSQFEHDILTDRISVLQPREPVVVAPDTPVREVLDLLVGQSIGCAIVVDEGEVVGIFSERDALMRVNTDVERCADRPICEFMTPQPETIERDGRITFALHKMDVGGYRHVPVVHDGRIEGVISIRDILNYLATHLVAG
jgi:CBS domain-containing protein